MNEANPWQDLVEGAEYLVRRAEAGDADAARRVLKQAAVAIRGTLKGLTPDPERLVYLAYLEKAITLIANGAPPDKALGLWIDHRPTSVSLERDLNLFFAVGRAYDRHHAAGRKNAVQRAKEQVVEELAGEPGASTATVEKAWQAFGGVKNWRRIKSDGLVE